MGQSDQDFWLEGMKQYRARLGNFWDLENFCSEKLQWWNSWRDGRDASWIIVFKLKLLLWFIGIFGNLVNVVVCRHKNMGNNPINSIFWWLSISDLSELVILDLYHSKYYCDGSLEILKTGVVYNGRDISYYAYYLSYIYLFLVSHTITIGLNIVLIFYQYKVVAHPLINQKDALDDRSIKLMIIFVYVSSFVLFLPFFNIYEVEHTMCKEDFGPGKFECWRFRVGNLENPLVYICILVCGIILRIGPLIILIILCVLLLFAIRNAHRDRQNLGIQAGHLSKAQRQVNRMNVTIVTLIIMFLISDIPLALSSFFVLSERYGNNCGALLDRLFVRFFVLLNCSYSIFCYLIRIKKYRETLKLLVSKCYWSSYLAPVTEQTDLESNNF